MSIPSQKLISNEHYAKQGQAGNDERSESASILRKSKVGNCGSLIDRHEYYPAQKRRISQHGSVPALGYAANRNEKVLQDTENIRINNYIQRELASFKQQMKQEFEEKTTHLQGIIDQQSRKLGIMQKKFGKDINECKDNIELIKEKVNRIEAAEYIEGRVEGGVEAVEEKINPANNEINLVHDIKKVIQNHDDHIKKMQNEIQTAMIENERENRSIANDIRCITSKYNRLHRISNSRLNELSTDLYHSRQNMDAMTIQMVRIQNTVKSQWQKSSVLSLVMIISLLILILTSLIDHQNYFIDKMANFGHDYIYSSLNDDGDYIMDKISNLSSDYIYPSLNDGRDYILDKISNLGHDYIYPSLNDGRDYIMDTISNFSQDYIYSSLIDHRNYIMDGVSNFNDNYIGPTLLKICIYAPLFIFLIILIILIPSVLIHGVDAHASNPTSLVNQVGLSSHAMKRRVNFVYAHL